MALCLFIPVSFLRRDVVPVLQRQDRSFVVFVSFFKKNVIFICQDLFGRCEWLGKK